MNTASLKKEYTDRIVPALTKQFGYKTIMQVPVLEKIVINEGLGKAVDDKKIIETAINELTAISGQKAVPTLSKKDISNFRLVRRLLLVFVSLVVRRCMNSWSVSFCVALPRIRDFKGIDSKLDGNG